MAETAPAPLEQVSATDERGRTLTGMGVAVDQLETTMDRHAPDPPKESPPIPGAPGTQPKPTRGQARFSELTQQRKDAEARAEAAERERDELKARSAQAPQAPPSAPTPPTPQAQSAAPSPPKVEPTRPKPTEDEIGGKYDTYADFIEDLSDWKTEQRMAALDLDARIQQGLEARTAAQTFTTHVEATRAKGRAAYRDFDQMLKSGPGTFVNMPMPAVHAILNHPQSEHLQYAVMKDKALAERLAQLAFQDPFAFAFELAKLVPVPSSNGNGHPPTPPAPMMPVGSGSRSTTPSSADHADAGNYEAYKAARAAERATLRR